MLFQSNLRKQIRKLPKIVKFVRIIHYYSKLFTGVLRQRALRLAGHRGRGGRVPRGARPPGAPGVGPEPAPLQLRASRDAAGSASARSKLN